MSSKPARNPPQAAAEPVPVQQQLEMLLLVLEQRKKLMEDRRRRGRKIQPKELEEAEVSEETVQRRQLEANLWVEEGVQLQEVTIQTERAHLVTPGKLLVLLLLLASPANLLLLKERVTA